MTFYLTLLALLFVWTIFNTISLPGMKNQFMPQTDAPLVSVLIPLRDEERNIPALINSLKNLSYNNVEFIFLNDNSTDNTDALLKEYIDGDARMKIISGKKLPEGWVGKVHACYQLAQYGRGEFFLFLDADVRVDPMVIQRSLALFKKGTGLITGFPHIPLKSFLGHLLVPMQHFFVYVHLPVLLANKTLWSKATAAHGAFMMFRAEAYHAIDGHKSVKNSLTEDIHIAKELKKHGWYVSLVNNTNFVSCYMYETNKEVWHGFAKNFFPGLGRSLTAAFGLTVVYMGLFILPALIAFMGILSLNLVYFLPLLLTFSIKLTVDVFSNQKLYLFLLFPLSAAAMLAMLAYSAYLGISRKGFDWKGRKYQ
ncbi:Glycosyltransferase, catalytic subunit of cellulose synthase and poly-beta-1,6-N-acetylglucosamine synthase [Alkalicoccus daliensis]|uniref:Glycosyltransferase, catalytic subunit of cellulose synthase and poly-beta-1,6-N-acetylglucosamine synthase n=2 Tax=Alkalicoccus daliensis TaxID=745820 RepID=A0A1H0B0S2_9BACI|nr:Glycosyltransferase, catalytic subunit of cellulose synthase and poly-beta-1,6-N-acetylglucosamine synthase [Alkalicoccus daliensis]